MDAKPQDKSMIKELILITSLTIVFCTVPVWGSFLERLFGSSRKEDAGAQAPETQGPKVIPFNGTGKTEAPGKRAA